MIDKEKLLENVNLLTLVGPALKRVASTEGGEYAGPCPFCGGRDRFRVQPNRKPFGLWFCRKCSDGHWGNAIDFVIRRDGCDFKTACLLALGGESGGAHPTTPAPRAPDPAYVPPDKSWQSLALQAIEKCAWWLRTTREGRKGLDYLKGRGLDDDFITAYSLGYSPGAHFGGLYVRRSITIPCIIGDEVWYIKTRGLPGDPERYKVEGKSKALFGAENLDGHEIGLIVEGELNAIIGDMVLGEQVGVASVGSASNKLDLAAFGSYLVDLREILVCYDQDKAGQAGATFWKSLSERVQLVQLPEGHKDINDFYLAGGDLQQWLGYWLFEQDHKIKLSHSLESEFVSRATAEAASVARMKIKASM